jgi:hypothetical protein
MPGFPTRTVGTPTNRGKAWRHNGKGRNRDGGEIAGEKSKTAAFKPKGRAFISVEIIFSYDAEA